MFEKLTDTVTLSNGVKVPCVGYGTWQIPDGASAVDGIKFAIENGYRHIDTAAGYGNEASVGDGIRVSGIKREEIFVTSKHWITDRGYSKTIAAIDTSLKTLGLDYLDMYLVHWPCVEKSTPNWKEVNASTWRGFEQAYKEGKIRAIGLSNYLPEHILALEETAEIKPMVNQIEFHPGYHQPDLVKWCQDHGMLVEAWSTLGCGAVLSSPTLQKIAAKYGKSTANVCLRFALQSGVLPLTKSVHPERVIENTKIFDFELSDDDMIAIKTMPPLGYSTYHAADAPADSLYGGDYNVD